MNSLAYPCASVPEVPEGHYSRLCPCPSGQWPPHNEEELAILAQMMRQEKPTADDHVMRSGYVYLGQFIDHDITRDTRLLDEAGCDVEQTWNYRTPCLDLDLLYGKDPSSVPCIYERDGRLRLGSTSRAKEAKSNEDDLPRESDGTPIVIDARSDENLAIAQTHVLFAKFHNQVLNLLKQQPDLSAGPVGTSLFEQARRFVTWHYQWIVRDDFLPHIVQNATLKDIEQNGLHLFPRAYTPADSPVALPVEFTVAAFRFGHSMVRNDYFWNEIHRNLKTSELIIMTKRGGGITKQLPHDFVISWKRFFTGTGSRVNRAENIDTFIAGALYDLPPQVVQAFRLQIAGLTPNQTPFRDRMIPPLPELTLRRGSRVRLPSGEEFAQRFGYTSLPAGQIPARPEDAEFFQQDGFRERTPLWYYLLREAAVEDVREGEREDGRWKIQKLGTTGGRIVAEVIHQLLNADYNSIVNAGKDWRPPSFTFGTFGTQTEPRSLDSMQEIVEFVRAT
jgi:hypothetical protein